MSTTQGLQSDSSRVRKALGKHVAGDSFGMIPGCQLLLLVSSGGSRVLRDRARGGTVEMAPLLASFHRFLEAHGECSPVGAVGLEAWNRQGKSGREGMLREGRSSSHGVRAQTRMRNKSVSQKECVCECVTL